LTSERTELALANAVGVCFLCALGIDDEPGPQLVEIVVPFTEEPEQTLTCLAHRECAQRVIHPEYRLPTYEEFVSDEWANYDDLSGDIP
jgi:hypothetical protein